MHDKVFIDSNVLLYALDEKEGSKNDVLQKILRDEEPLISPQVVFECLNVSTKKFKKTKKEALAFLDVIFEYVSIVSEDETIVSKALQLYHKHSLQVFDSKIIATALLNGCSILYSEDLQHGQVFERKLKIINPFFKK